jgi:fructose-1,6-bisphosphatase II
VVAGRAAGPECDRLFLGEEIGLFAGRDASAAEAVGGGAAELLGIGEYDLAVKPLEGQSVLAKGLDGALSMLAVGPRGSLMSVPDMYMQKIAVGRMGAEAIDMDAPVEKNLKNTAAALGKSLKDLAVTVLERPRHEDLIEEIKRCGCRLTLIEDGDVSASIAAAVEETGVDICIGIGGSTEGIVTAAAMRCLGGEIQGRFWPVSRYQVETIKAMGIEDAEARLTSKEMAGEGVLVAATAVTRGRFLRGIAIRRNEARTETILMCSRCHKIRLIRTIHRAPEAASAVALWEL